MKIPTAAVLASRLLAQSGVALAQGTTTTEKDAQSTPE